MSGGVPPFSWNLVTDLRDMWQYNFMRNAFEAATIIAIVAGIIGYFVVLRRRRLRHPRAGACRILGRGRGRLVRGQPGHGLLLFTMSAGTGMSLLGTELPIEMWRSGPYSPSRSA